MSTPYCTQKLYYIPKPSRWTKGIGAELPEAYKKFWYEWKIREPVPVHYIKEEGKYKRDEKSGQVYPVQNVPIPLMYPKELQTGIWGGEAIVRGFEKRHKLARRTPKFWIPQLQNSVVYSEVLDTYMKTTLTERTMKLIHENYGFDHYLLKTPACDLRSQLALKIKRSILLALANKTLYRNDSVKRAEVYDQYKQYLQAYTREEIEWYGLTYKEAIKKWLKYTASITRPKPLKHQYRTETILWLEKMKEEKENSVATPEAPPTIPIEPEKPTPSKWSKLNPFAKNE